MKVIDGMLMSMGIDPICGIIDNMKQTENMITVYEEHIKNLEKENRSLKMQVDFLKEQLAYKTFGKPNLNEKS
jgi:regulator of replication initiation timing